MPRLISLLLLLVLVPSADAQTSDELKAKYGKPIVELFSVRPNIALAVAYTADGQVCQLLIEPPKSLLRKPDEPSTFMTTEAVSSLMDELVPPRERGEQVYKVVTERGCTALTVTEYARVKISRAQHTCKDESPGRDVNASLTFKDRVCKGQ